MVRLSHLVIHFKVWESVGTQAQARARARPWQIRKREHEKPRWWIAICNEKYSCSYPFSFPSATCLRESEAT